MAPATTAPTARLSTRDARAGKSDLAQSGLAPHLLILEQALFAEWSHFRGTCCGKEKTVTDAIERALGEIKFGPDGLVPAIAQQHDTGEVLMLAWMNPEAVRLTLAEGRACYWSRARRALWRKGETSGQIQRLHELRLDCDGDAVLLLVDQEGVACHTGRRSCFFRARRDAEWAVIAEPEIAPEQLYPTPAD
jgi:phosphoribosyl-AMP cyclohydrolase